jgi:uncharacterized integral membrane protein
MMHQAFSSRAHKTQGAEAMFEFFAGASPALGLWMLGAFVLGAVLAYGAMRAGWLTPRERAQLDENTRARQRSEDPQKMSGAAR